MISLRLAVSSPKKYKARGVFASLGSLLLALSALAQGDPLYGARHRSDRCVGLRRQDRDQEPGIDTERRLITDDAGLFNAAALPVGRYEIPAAKTGFQTDRRRSIRLTVAEREEVDLKLQVETCTRLSKFRHFHGPPKFDRGFFRPGSRARSEGLAAKRTKFRSNADAESRHRQLHIAAVRRIGTSNSVIGNMFVVSGRRPQESLFLLNGWKSQALPRSTTHRETHRGQLLGVDAIRENAVVTEHLWRGIWQTAGRTDQIVTANGTNAFRVGLRICAQQHF